MTTLLNSHEHYLSKASTVTKGPKIPKNLTTWFMDDPEDAFKIVTDYD